MSVDSNAELQFGGLRDNFWRSSGTFLSAVDATVTVNDWYTAEFSDSGLKIVNTDESAGSGYDQLTITLMASLDDVDAPDVDTGTETFTVNSIEFNIYSDLPDMILGSGAAYPTPDVPMPIPGVNFFPEDNTQNHFIIRFAEGGGVNMLRGTFNDFAVVPEASHVAALLALGAVALVGLKRRKRA